MSVFGGFPIPMQAKLDQMNKWEKFQVYGFDGKIQEGLQILQDSGLNES